MSLPPFLCGRGQKFSFFSSTSSVSQFEVTHRLIDIGVPTVISCWWKLRYVLPNNSTFCLEIFSTALPLKFCPSPYLRIYVVQLTTLNVEPNFPRHWKSVGELCTPGRLCWKCHVLHMRVSVTVRDRKYSPEYTVQFRIQPELKKKRFVQFLHPQLPLNNISTGRR